MKEKQILTLINELLVETTQAQDECPYSCSDCPQQGVFCRSGLALKMADLKILRDLSVQLVDKEGGGFYHLGGSCEDSKKS
jgi:hypothetical protein